MNLSQLAKYHNALGYEEAGMKYEAIADNLCRAVNQVPVASASCTRSLRIWSRSYYVQVLWNEEDGTWYDYDTLNGEQRRYFFPSNLAPLWTNTMEEENESEKARTHIHT